MHQLSSFRRRLVTLVAGLAFAAPLAAAAPTPRRATIPAPRDATAYVTESDVAASNAKIRMAYDALIAMWQDDFQQIGGRFAAPGLVRYRRAVRTGCGVMGGNNAAYCPNDNAIYFDEVFVAAQAKNAAAQVGTDGDMAAVGIIAHEMGHAVALQLGHESPYTYQNEAAADCLAGAFANRANRNGELEKGDVEEAFYAMFSAGDPEPELTGDARVDQRIMRTASLMGHGTYDKRMANFKAGLDGGAGSCLGDFRGLN
jgi:uncharacterized protein